MRIRVGAVQCSRDRLAGAQQQKLAGAVPGELTGTHQEEPASPELTVISAPDSSTDQPLQEKAEPKKRAPWYRRRRPLIAAAACVLLAICLIPAMKAVLPDNSAENHIFWFSAFLSLHKHPIDFF